MLKNKCLNWVIHMVCYTLVLILIAVIFCETIKIDNSYFGLWGLIAVIIIFVLNKTIKPILVFLTLPVTAITFGIFYPVINLFILKITDLILGNHFEIKSTRALFVVSIFISIMNKIMDSIIKNKLEEGSEK